MGVAAAIKDKHVRWQIYDETYSDKLGSKWI